MSAIKEYHRWMDELRQEDMEILADIAYRQEQAMQEAYEPDTSEQSTTD